jgi:hypothetical protein
VPVRLIGPDVVVQIAHLRGGNEFVPAALGMFADAVHALIRV